MAKNTEKKRSSNYDVISFDLWGTLIISNKEYSKKRCEIVREHCSKSMNTIESTFHKVKKDFDYLVERYGLQFKSNELYKIIFNELSIESSEHAEIISKLKVAFIKNLPHLYDSNTLKTLKKLSKDHKLVLISNTLLVEGELLRFAMKKLGILDLFDVTVFSDEAGCSKPNVEIFEKALKNVHGKVLHIGDNELTDFGGANRYGIDCFVINGSADRSISMIPYIILDTSALWCE